MAWQKNGTPDTLSSSADQVNLTDMTPFLFQFFLHHILRTGGTTFGKGNCGSGSIDTGSNYCTRRSPDGASDITATSQTKMEIFSQGGGSNEDDFCIGYMINIADEEKLMMFWEVNSGAVGAGNAPPRQDSVHKWVNTSNQCDHFRITNDGTGDYDTDSNLSSLGTD